MSFQMPSVYRTIGNAEGLPLNWQDETTGTLAGAVRAYLENQTEGAPISEEQLKIVRAYLRHYVEAPCWSGINQDPELGSELAALRRDVVNLKTTEDIAEWIWRCLAIGLDPL